MLRARHLSPVALAAAAAVLVVGGGSAGAVAAQLITSAQIKDRTIRVVDLHPSAVRSLRGRRGPAGPGGSPGPAGGFDPAKVTVRVSPEVAVPPNALRDAQADCAAGEVAVAGGFVATSGQVWRSRPTDDGRGWLVGVDSFQVRVANGAVRAYAICSRP